MSDRAQKTTRVSDEFLSVYYALGGDEMQLDLEVLSADVELLEGLGFVDQALDDSEVSQEPKALGKDIK